MKTIDIDPIIRNFLQQGLTVCYVDQNKYRREHAESLWLDKKQFKVMDAVLNGRASLHYNVLITVNEENYPTFVRKELNNVAAYCNGVAPCIVRIAL